MKSTDPNTQDSTEFAHDIARNGLRYEKKVQERVRQYMERENPRGMPEKWVEHYLDRDRTLLALDVIRGYDKSLTVEKSLGWMRIWHRILTAALVGSWILFGWAAKFVFDHLAMLERMR